MQTMSVQELVTRYPAAGDLVALGNEVRENHPTIARVCDAVCGLIADLKDILPEPPPVPVSVAAANALGAGDLQAVLNLVQQQSDVVAKLQAQLAAQASLVPAIEVSDASIE